MITENLLIPGIIGTYCKGKIKSNVKNHDNVHLLTT
jgi:hypothetical protein